MYRKEEAMRIAIIDADLIGRKRHRFPNLVCMKLSGFYKSAGQDVCLKTDYDGLGAFDKVYIAKVFTDTEIPSCVLQFPNVKYGGTGFFYDKAKLLPHAIEHHMPDYRLYEKWVNTQIAAGKRRQEFTYYLDCSIGFLTRGCFRGCVFCVNRNYKRVCRHSPLVEFLDPARKKICLLDDNFLGHPGWEEMLLELRATGKPFQFKQGLDERLLTERMCELLFTSKYDGDFIFAFDNIADADIIQRKIRLARRYTNAVMKFYCFTGFDRQDKWNAAFWRQDIFDLLRRIEILMKHRCLPYIMRYRRYEESPYRGLYITLSRWCNQPAFYKKKSLREFAVLNGEKSAAYRYMSDFEKEFPEAAYFFDLKYEEAKPNGQYRTVRESSHRQTRPLRPKREDAQQGADCLD